MRIFVALGVVVACASTVGLAFASGNHHSAPMGGRSALMGGTGVALGVDGAGPFLNPATIARIETGKLAFSARFYRLTRTTVRDFHTPGSIDEQFGTATFGDTDEINHSLHSIPDSVCYFFPPFGRVARTQRLSLCLTTLEEQELSLTALGLSRSSNGVLIDQNQHFDSRWSRFNFGPTWGAVVTNDIMVGASFLISFSRYKHTILGSSVIETTAGTSTTSNYESLVSAASWDLATRFGATYRLSQRFTVGASATLPIAHVLGTFRHTRLADLNGSRAQWWGEGGFRALPPIEFRAGLGGEWHAVRFEADASLTLGSASYVRGDLDRQEVVAAPGQPAMRAPSTLGVNERTHATLNLALGVETFVAPRFSLLFGAQTDVNALHALQPGAGESRLFRTKIDYYRTGAGICSYTDYGDLMLGLRFDYGKGEAMPANTLSVPSALGRSDVNELGFMAVLAGSLSWRSISQAVNDIGDVVSGEGGAPPKKPPTPLRAPKRKD